MTRRVLPVLVTACIACALLQPRVVQAQEEPRRSLREQLTVRVDFEKDADEDDYPDADEWHLREGRRHPQNIRHHLDGDVRQSGTRSLRIELDGVPTVFETAEAFRYDGRFSYRLTGHIRAEGVPGTGLRASSASIELVGIARDGTSEVYHARTTPLSGTHDWQTVVLDVPRDPELLFDRVRIRCRADGLALEGKVWFDAIELSPRPTLAIGGGDPDGCFSPGAQPVADVSMHTLIDGDYDLLAELYDPAGRLVSKSTLKVTPRLGYLADAKVELSLETFGSHRLVASLLKDDVETSSASRSLLCWPGETDGRVSSAWGVYAGSIYRLGESRADLLRKSRFGTVGFDLFGDGDPADEVTALPALRSAAQLGRLRQQQAEPVLVLGSVPPEIVNRLFRERQVVSVSDASWLRTLSLDRKYWSTKITRTVPPFASRVECYQIGHVADHSASAADLVRAVKQLRETLTPLTYRCRIGVVFDGTEPPEKVSAAAACDFVVIDCPADVPVETVLPQVVTRFKTSVKEVWVSLRVPWGGMSATRDADRLMSRMVLARSAGADRVNVRFLEAGIESVERDPSPAFSAASTVAREIGGKFPAGALTTSVRAFLFADAADARLAVLPPDRAPDAVYLGTRLRRIDPDGNAVPVTLLDGRAVLDNSGRPYLLSGLELDAVLTRLSLTVGPVYSRDGRLQAASRKQRIAVSLTNCFAKPLTGTIDVIPPEGWEVDRRQVSLLLEPGQPAAFQTDVGVPVTEESGEHLMRFRLKLAGREMLVSRKVVLAPRALETVVSVEPTPDGGLTVSQKVTNRDVVPARLALFVVTPDAGRMERYANGIAPGSSTEVSFKLDRVTSDRLWIGWRETSGQRFFNRYVSLTRAPE